MNSVKRFAGSAIIAGALVVPAALSSTVDARRPLFTGGLVNVTVTDVIGDITLEDINVGLGVAAGIAANVCDLNVAAVIADIKDDGSATCTSEATGQTVDITQR